MKEFHEASVALGSFDHSTIATIAIIAPSISLRFRLSHDVMTDTNHYLGRGKTLIISIRPKYVISVENLCWINYIRNLEPNCQYSCSSSSDIVAKSLPPPQNLCMPLNKFACVSLRYIKRVGVGGNSGSVL